VVVSLLLTGGIVASCLTERTNPLYCDGRDVKCGPGDYCDVALRTCKPLTVDMACEPMTGKSENEVCVADSECMSRVCWVGRCLHQTSAVYVDNKGGACSGTHDGCFGDPVCSIDEGFARAKVVGRNIMVVAGSTAPYSVSAIASASLPTAFTIIGPGRDAAPPARLIKTSPTAAINVSGDGQVALEVRGFTIHGILCGSPSGNLKVRAKQNRLPLDGNSYGVGNSGCAVSLTESIIGPGAGAPIRTFRGSTELVNCVVAGVQPIEGTVAVFSAGAVGRIAFSTITDVRGPPDGGSDPQTTVLCGGSDGGVMIEDSIIAYTRVPDAGQPIGSGCLYQNVVVGPVMQPGSGTLTALPDFVDPSGDYRLRDTAENRRCCIDRAQAGTAAAPATDIDGTTRPQGAASDVGAYELKP
jgi:hypothetical protein